MDPTYERDLIEKNDIWKLAFVISEFLNDKAPIGWGQYIPLASHIINNYQVRMR